MFAPLSGKVRSAFLRVGVDIGRLDLARLGQGLAERLHRVFVERHGVRELHQLRSERQIEPQRLRHGVGREAVKLLRLLRLRMIGIHRGIHPDGAE